MKYKFPVPEGFEPPEESMKKEEGAIGAIKYYIKDDMICPLEFEGFEIQQKEDEEEEDNSEDSEESPAYKIFREKAKQ